jgi:hypothetical protein
MRDLRVQDMYKHIIWSLQAMRSGTTLDVVRATLICMAEVRAAQCGNPRDMTGVVLLKWRPGRFKLCNSWLL